MTDGSLQNAVHTAVKSEWLTLIARAMMIIMGVVVTVVIAPLLVWLFVTVDETSTKIVEIGKDVDQLASRVQIVEKTQAETQDYLDATREARRRDWQTVFEGLATIKSEIGNLKEQAAENRKVLGEIRATLPRRDGSTIIRKQPDRILGESAP